MSACVAVVDPCYF